MNRSRFSAFLLFMLFQLVAGIVYAMPTGRVSLGYFETSGNSKDQNVNFQFNLSEKKNEKLDMGYDGAVLYGRSAGTTNSDKKSFGITSEFIQDSRNSFYLRSGYLTDEFAGYDQRLNMGFGYLKKLINDEKKSLQSRVGVEMTRDEYTDASKLSMEWLKLGFMGYNQINDNTKIHSKFDFDSPRKDYRTKYQIDMLVGVLVTVSDRMDMEVSHTTNYRKTPVVVGKQKTDSMVVTSLVYKI